MFYCVKRYGLNKMKAKFDTLRLVLIAFLIFDLNVEILSKKKEKHIGTRNLIKKHVGKPVEAKLHKKIGFIVDPELEEISKVCMKNDYMTQRIIKGIPASREAFPFVAAVFLNMDGIFNLRCAGSIISKNHILTAAHCFFRSGDSSKPYTNNSEDIFVRLGDFNIVSPHDDQERGVINRQIVRFWTHDLFGVPNEFDNDIALLRLNESLLFNNQYIQPVCISNLNAPRQQLIFGTELGVAGWGKLIPSGESSTILQFTAMNVIHINHCINKLNNPRNVIMNICVGHLNGLPGRTCHGDSGGPFVPYPAQTVIPIAVGIVSFGPRNCDQPAMMTNVATYYDWINYRVGLNWTLNGIVNAQEKINQRS